MKTGVKGSLYTTALAIVLTTATMFSVLTAPAAQAFDLPLTIAPDQLSGYERTLFKHWIDADKDKWLRFLISNTAVAAGIWAGQEKSIFEAASQFTDLSPVQGQVRVMRTFVRGILSEGLSTRVAADALSRSGKAETSKIDGLLPFPNQFLEAYEGERIVEVIDEMVEKTIGFAGSRLRYDEVVLVPPPDQEDTGLIAGLKYFFKTTWSLFKVLPLWFFGPVPGWAFWRLAWLRFWWRS